MAERKSRYPGRAVVERTVAAAIEAGVEIGGLELDARGVIRILAPGSATPRQVDDYAEWRRQRDW